MSRRGAGVAGASVRSLSSGSMTPMEDEEEAPKRSTRGRNPLPPTNGPLFPPLPPKVPKVKSNKSPNAVASASGSASQSGVEADAEAAAGALTVETTAPAPGSGGSLSPPPADGGEAGGTPTGGSERRRGRAPPVRRAIDVKVEDDVHASTGANGTGTANGNGTGKTRRYSTHLAPPESGGDSETEAGSAKPKKGRRRGEDQLLFDDHLLPEELRRLGKMSGKRARDSNASATSERSAKQRRGSSVKRDVEREHEHAVQDDEDDRAPAADLAATDEAKEGEPGKQQAEEAKEEQGTDADISEPPPEVPDSKAAQAPQREEDDDDEGLTEEKPDDEGEPLADLDAEEDEVDQGGGGVLTEVTRCVCQREEDNDEFMISCDACSVWQHGPCVGVWNDTEAFDEYYCEKCRPELHGPLRKWIRSRGRNIENFVPPQPDDLKALHSPYDKYPPSQSKIWLSPPASKKGKAKDTKSQEKDKKDEKDRVVDREDKRDKDKSRSKEKEGSPERRKSVAGSVTAGAGGRDKDKDRDAREPSSGREKPDSSRGPNPNATTRRQASHGPSSHGQRPVSITVDAPSPPLRDSQSPMTFQREPKRRSTMNSRDAAIEEEQMRLALEESRREMRHGSQELVEVDGEVMQGDAVDLEHPADGMEVEEEGNMEVEKEVRGREKGKGKARREEESAEPSPAPNKPKHPNQYTYRPKPSGPIPTPARRGGQGGTPAPVLGPAQHEHGTRRAAGLANGAREAPFVAVQTDNLSWNIPDHLSQYADLLPTSDPMFLSVRSPRPVANLAKNHFLNWKYGPFEDKRDPITSRLLMLTDGPEREVLGEKGERHTEVNARPKWPHKRMTTAEMRKRVRGMLEFVGKVQIDEGKRGERRQALGIPEYGYELAKEASKRRKLDGVAEADADAPRQEDAAAAPPPPAASAALEASGEATNDPPSVSGTGIHPLGSSESQLVEPTPNGLVNGAAPADGLHEAPSVPDVEAEAAEEQEEEEEAPTKNMSTGPPLSQLLSEIMAELVEFEDTWMRPGGAPAVTSGNGSGSGAATGSGKGMVPSPLPSAVVTVESSVSVGPSTATSGVDGLETAPSTASASISGTAAPSEIGKSGDDGEVTPVATPAPIVHAEAATTGAGKQRERPNAISEMDAKTLTANDATAAEQNTIDKPDVLTETSQAAEAASESAAGPPPSSPGSLAAPTSAQEVPAETKTGANAGATVETIAEPIDVYRGGKVGVVVAEPAEEAAAETIEREAEKAEQQSGPLATEAEAIEAAPGSAAAQGDAAVPPSGGGSNFIAAPNGVLEQVESQPSSSALPAQTATAALEGENKLLDAVRAQSGQGHATVDALAAPVPAADNAIDALTTGPMSAEDAGASLAPAGQVEPTITSEQQILDDMAMHMDSNIGMDLGNIDFANMDMDIDMNMDLSTFTDEQLAALASTDIPAPAAGVTVGGLGDFTQAATPAMPVVGPSQAAVPPVPAGQVPTGPTDNVQAQVPPVDAAQVVKTSDVPADIDALLASIPTDGHFASGIDMGAVDFGIDPDFAALLAQQDADPSLADFGGGGTFSTGSGQAELAPVDMAGIQGPASAAVAADEDVEMAE